jgi:hypothetical protein
MFDSPFLLVGDEDTLVARLTRLHDEFGVGAVTVFGPDAEVLARFRAPDRVPTQPGLDFERTRSRTVEGVSTTDVAPELAAETLDLIDAGAGVGDEDAACIGPDALATALVDEALARRPGDDPPGAEPTLSIAEVAEQTGVTTTRCATTSASACPRSWPGSPTSRPPCR